MTNSYKRTGEVLGNAPRDYVEQDSPANKSTITPTTHPSGAKAVAWGEAGLSLSVNRAFAQAARNADVVQDVMCHNLAVPLLLDNSDAAGLTLGAPAAELDISAYASWIYHGAVIADLASSFKLLNDDNVLVVNGAGDPVTVDDVLSTSGGATLVAAGPQSVHGPVAVTAPTGAQTDRRDRIAIAVPLTASIGAAESTNGLFAVLAGNTVANLDGTNNGIYKVINGVGGDTEFLLRECRYRLRANFSVAFVNTEVITGGTSGATYTINTALGSAIGADYIEMGAYGLTPPDGVFLAGETITGSIAGAGVVIRYSSPDDPVILNNSITLAGTVEFYSDADFSQGVFLTLSDTIPAGDYKLICGGRTHLYELYKLDLLGLVANSGLDSSGSTWAVLDNLSLDMMYDGNRAPVTGDGAGRKIVTDVGPVVLMGDAETYERIGYSVTSSAGFEMGEDLKVTNAGGLVIGQIIALSPNRLTVAVVGPGAVPAVAGVIYGDTSTATATVDVKGASLTGQATVSMAIETADVTAPVAEDPDGLNLTSARPAATVTLSPIHDDGGNIEKYGEAATYTNADADFVVTSGPALSAFTALSAYQRWPEVWVEVFDADDPEINGFYAPAYYGAGPTNDVVALSMLGSGGATALNTAAVTGANCMLRWWSVNTMLRGYTAMGASMQQLLTVPSAVDAGAGTDYLANGQSIYVMDPNAEGAAIYLDGLEGPDSGNNAVNSSLLFIEQDLATGSVGWLAKLQASNFSSGLEISKVTNAADENSRLLEVAAGAGVGITSSSVANPSEILCANPHYLLDGQQVTISGHAGSTPDINGTHVITLVSQTQFTIPVNVTVGGAGGTIDQRPLLLRAATNVDAATSPLEDRYVEIPVLMADEIISSFYKTSTDGAVKIDLKTSSEVRFQVTDGGALVKVATLDHTANSYNRLEIASPDGSDGELAITDKVGIDFAHDFRMEAEGKGATAPALTLRRLTSGPAEDQEILVLDGTNGSSDLLSDEKERPVAVVSDIKYGSDVTHALGHTYSGKMIENFISVMAGMDSDHTFAMTGLGEGVEMAMFRAGVGAQPATRLVYAMPPFALGSAAGVGEAGDRYFCGARVIGEIAVRTAGTSITCSLLLWDSATQFPVLIADDVVLATAATLTFWMAPGHRGTNLGAPSAIGELDLAANASTIDDAYNGWEAVCTVSGTGGPAVGEVVSITDYDGGTQVATVSPNWSAAPVADTEYAIVPVAEGFEHHGTPAAGGATTITLDTRASNQDDYYTGRSISLFRESADGAVVSEIRRIVGYVGSTKVATVESAWTDNPLSGVSDKFAIGSADLDTSAGANHFYLRVLAANPTNGDDIYIHQVKGLSRTTGALISAP